ncbi:MAG: alpha/beta fold hydrolase [Oceanicaulis sp.]
MNSLFRVNLDNGRGRRIARDRSYQRIIDADGEIAAELFYDFDDGDFEIRSERGGTIYVGEHSYDRPYVAGFVDETGLALIGVDDPSVKRLDLETGEITPAYDVPEGEYQGPLRDRYGQVWALRPRTFGQSHYIIDPALRADHDALREVMGEDIWIESFSDDRNKILFATRAPTKPPEYLLYDREAADIQFLGRAYPDLAERPLPERSMITYEAADGLEIRAVLTTPPGHDGEPAPLVVLPHGGPAAADGVRFDWWAQAIASQGYVVLQPNFRGSAGYGREFREAGFGEFGGLMIEDILDGARHLQAEGIAREGGFCVTGGSYGGYAALMSAVRAPQEVACVVAVAPVTEPLTMLGRYTGDGAGAALDWWEDYMGSRFQDAEAAAAISPVAQHHRLTMPVLLVHGQLDDVVPVTHSRRLAEVMEGADGFSYMELATENHFLQMPRTRRDLLQRSLALFDETLSDGAP